MPNITKDPALRHAPGIYFGMPEAVYHADTALGSTDMRLLASRPWKWQYDRLRPTTRRTTADMVWGSAWHCRVLEGKAEFEERYRRKPDPEDYPGCLVTADDMKAWLRAREQPVSGTKPVLVERIRSFLDAPVIFEDVLAEFNARPRESVSADISSDIVQEVNDAVANMERDPTLRAVMQAGSLIDGAAEVSVFYEVNGIRRKARFDYAIPPVGQRQRSLIVDLKSFSSFKGRTPDESAKLKIYEMGYDVQALDYKTAHGFGADLVKADAIFGEEPRAGFCEEYFAADADFVWVMLKRDEGMLPITLSIEASDIHFRNIADTLEQAYRNHAEYTARFGPERLWTPEFKLPARLTYADFPSYDRGF